MADSIDNGNTRDDTGQKIFIVVLDVTVLFVIFAIANSDLVSVYFWPWGPVQIPSFLLLAAGFAAGVFSTVLLYKIARYNSQNSWIYIVLFCAAVMAVAAIRTEQLSFTRALLIIMLGGAALVTIANALSLLSQGESIELQSNWGGLGGGLGGWRLSPATGLVLLACIFAGAATIAGQPSQGGGPTKETRTTETKQTKDVKEAKVPDVASTPPKQPAGSP